LLEPAAMLKWLWLSGFVILLDQLTKQWIDATMQLYQSIEVIPFFQLTYLRNQGAAFSFLSDAGGWQRWFFVALSSGASIAIGVWLARLHEDRRWEAIALALILGGAVGNLIDRLFLGYVIDFLDVFYGGWHWPPFNLADSAITIGVVMLLVDSFRQRQTVSLP
jgi:signal peptidase II